MGIGFRISAVTAALLVCPHDLPAVGPSSTEWEDAAGTFTTGQNGNTTDVQNPAGPNHLNAVHGRSRPNGGTVMTNNVWAVGDGGTLLYYNGGTWSQEPSPVGVNLYDVYILPTPNVANNVAGWAVGEQGTIIRLPAAGNWVCDVNFCPATCGAGEGGTLNICATLYEIVPVDPTSPDSDLFVVGTAQCDPPDSGPPPGGGGANPTILWYDSSANTWTKLKTGIPTYPLNLASWSNQFLCENCGLCVPVNNPGYMGNFFTGLITDFSGPGTPTAGGAFESSRIRVHMWFNGVNWASQSGISCMSPCGAAGPFPNYYTSALLGNTALVAGDTDTCVGCPDARTSNFHIFAPPGAQLRKINTGLVAATFGTIRDMDLLQLWGFGIGVGCGAAGGADYDDPKPDAYLALMKIPDPSKNFAPEDPSSPNSVAYWQKPAGAPWPRLNGTFIVDYNEAWAVGDAGTILHWTAPAAVPAALDVSLSYEQVGAWIQVVMSATNTGGTVLENFAYSLNLASGSAAAICGPVCVTEYCAATPGCPATLPPGGPAHLTWSYTLTGCYPVSFDGSVSGTDGLAPYPAIGPATDSITLPFPPLDFTIVKNQVPPSPGTGAPVTYTIRVTNTGATTITSLVVVDTASPVLAGQSTIQDPAFTPPAVAHLAGGTRYTWSAGGLNLLPGQFYDFTVSGVVGTVCLPTTVNNTAYGRAASDCRNAAKLSNQTSFSLPAPSLNFTVAKEQAGAWTTGSAVTYRVIVRNTGAATIRNLIVVDTVTPLLVGQATAQPAGFLAPAITHVAGSGTRYEWSASFLNFYPGDSYTFSVTGTVAPVCAVMPVTNRGYITGWIACGQLYQFTNLVGPSFVSPLAAGITVDKIQTIKFPTDVGTTLWYNVVVRNTGAATITSLTVVDTIHPLVTVIGTDQPPGWAAPATFPVGGGLLYRWARGGIALNPGQILSYTVTGVLALPPAPTTVTNEAYGWGVAACAAGEDGSPTRSFLLNPPLAAALSVSAVQIGLNSYRVTLVLTVTSTASAGLIQTSSFTSRLSSVPAGFSLVSGADPAGLVGLSPGGRTSYSWVGETPGPLPLAFGACTSATIALTGANVEICAQAAAATAVSLLEGAVTVSTIQACPDSPYDYFFTVVMDVKSNAAENVFDLMGESTTLTPPPGASLLSGPSPAVVAGPVGPGSWMLATTGQMFTWTFSATGAPPFDFNLSVSGSTTVTGIPVYGSGAGTGGLGGAAAVSELVSMLATTSRFNESEGLAGRWEITVVLTVSRTGANDVEGVFPAPPVVAPAGRAGLMYDPLLTSLEPKAVSWMEGTTFYDVRDSSLRWDGRLTGSRPAVYFAWTYTMSGTADLTFTADVCASSKQGAQMIPTYTVATAAISLIAGGEVGVYTINRNLMRGRTEVVTASFNLKEAGYTTLTVYNSIGQRIRTLFQAYTQARYDHDLVWDGTNDAGERVASGVYYIRLEGRRFVLTKKVALIK